MGHWKHFLVVVLAIALLITVTDQFTNLIKFTFQRLRPCNNPEFEGIIRVVKSSSTFSFFSVAPVLQLQKHFDILINFEFSHQLERPLCGERKATMRRSRSCVSGCRQ